MVFFLSFSPLNQHTDPPHVERTPDPISVTVGDPLNLTCSAVGNPIPSYTWTPPSASRLRFNGSILTIKSVTSADEGQYICSAHNVVGTVTVKFNVVVQGEFRLLTVVCFLISLPTPTPVS